MGARLDDASVIKHIDAVGVRDGAQPVGRSERRSALCSRREGELNNFLRLRVKGRRRLVQQPRTSSALPGELQGRGNAQHRGLPQERLSYSQPLLLPPRHAIALCADRAVQSFRKRHLERGVSAAASFFL